ncbi:uncharacterized protein DUF1942 [Mycobacterium sp. BK558]|jgi:hypothetical protein|nr:uncharacterized protein DUF1942 [Mycobacterium sp. BK558]
MSISRHLLSKYIDGGMVFAPTPLASLSTRPEGHFDMRSRVNLAAFVAAALLAASATFSPPVGAAMTCGHKFGSSQQLNDAGGAVVQEWMVTDLRKLAAALPGYVARGHVWEATATVRAATGVVTPVIPNLYAVTADGQRYPVLWQIASPHGLPPSILSQGQSSSGAIYFDVTGPEPMAVVFDNGNGTQLIWCCSGSMTMSMENCPMCADMQCPCPHCRGEM